MVLPAEIERPTALTALTLPIDKESGRTFASPVNTLQDLSKRRRTEIAVAVDGASIDIYNVQSSSLVTSYPFPPQSTFLTAPASILRKLNKENIARRFTYACVKPDLGSTIQRLTGFAVNGRRTVSASPDSYSTDLIDANSSPILLDIFPTVDQYGAQDHTVLLVSADGTFSGFSSTLNSSRWINKDLQQLDPEARILHASLTDSGRARKGLLKNREDLVARFGTDQNADGVQILSLVSTSPKSTHLHLFALRPQTTSENTESAPPAIYLDQFQLPLSLDTASIDLVQWTMDTAAGILFAQTQTDVFTVNLTSIVPRVISTFTLPKSDIGSSIYLGSNVMGFSSPSLNFVCDLHYSSILATGANDDSTALSSITRKRKRGGDTEVSPQPLKFVSYFSKLHSAIGVLDGQLVSLSIPLNLHGNGRSETLLIDSLGKGVARPLLFKGIPRVEGMQTIDWFFVDTNQDAEWVGNKLKLEEFAKSQDIPSFEKMFGDLVGITVISEDTPRLKKDKKYKPSADDGCLFLGPKTWNVRRLKGQVQRSYPEIAAFALRVIFELGSSSEGQSGLKIRFLPPNVFRWLAHSGHLTPANLQDALQPHNELRATQLTAADFVSCFVSHDPTMCLFHDFVRLQSHLDVVTLMQVIKTIIKCLDNDRKYSDSDDPILGDSPSSTDDEMSAESSAPNDATPSATPNAETEEVDEAVDALSRDVDCALAALKYGTFIRGRSLRRALTKLHSFPLSVVTAQLRSELTVHEIIFFIQLLRIELVDGGWTTRYFCEVPSTQDWSLVRRKKRGDDKSENRSQVADEAVTMISDLISSAVDAIGISGWLNEAAVEDEDTNYNAHNGTVADSLLTSLQGQIALTLEGLNEAAFITGILDGFFKYTSDLYTSVSASRTEDARDRPWNKNKHSARNNHVGTNDPVLEWNEKMSESALLPVGGKIDEIPMFRKNQQAQSSMLLGQSSSNFRQTTERYRANEISKRVGKYSREVIRF